MIKKIFKCDICFKEVDYFDGVKFVVTFLNGPETITSIECCHDCADVAHLALTKQVLNYARRDKKD